MRRSRFTPFFLLICSLWLGACGGSDSNRNRSTGQINTGFLQLVNGIVDSPVLTVNSGSGAITVQFQQATAISELAVGTTLIEITAVHPVTGVATTVIPQFEVNIATDEIHTVILRGSYANPDTLRLVKPFGDVSSVDSSQTEVQVVNLTSGTFDVYFGDSALDITADTPIATVTGASNTEPLRIDFGAEESERSLRLRVADAGTTDVRYDSGAFIVPVASRRNIVILDPIGPDPSTKAAIVVNEGGATTYPNEAARAALRIVNTVADELNATIDLIDQDTGTVLDTVNVDFGDVTDYQLIDPDFIDASVSVESNPGVEVVRATLSVNEDTFYTVLVAGSSLDDAVSVRSASSFHRDIETRTNVQFINGLRETGIVDVNRVDLYVLDIGDAIADTTPQFAQIAFGSSGVATLISDTYDLVLTAAGTESILAGPTRIDLGAVNSVLILSAEAVGGGTPSQLIIHTGP